MSIGSEFSSLRLRAGTLAVLASLGVLFSAVSSDGRLAAPESPPPAPHLARDIRLHPTRDLAPEGLMRLDTTLLFFGSARGERYLTMSIWGLVRSDGTAEGTSLIKAFSHPPSSYSSAVLGRRILFQACTVESGCELWASDGTPDGTALVIDIAPGGDGSYPTELTSNGTLAIFTVYRSGRPGTEIWSTDGTAGGTQLLRSSAAGSMPIFPHPASSPFVFFADSDAASGLELWCTDGTPAGTRLVRDIRPGPEGSGPGLPVAGDRVLFFVADDGIHGPQVWRSDGTSEGTTLLKDAGGPTSPAIRLAWARTHLFFVTGRVGSPTKLWVSDGSEAGTTEVISVSIPSPEDFTDLVAVGDRIFFFGREQIHGSELWISDGTILGTHIVLDITPGFNSTNLFGPVAFGNMLLFNGPGSDSRGELWRSDGTSEGTAPVSSSCDGRCPLNTAHFLEANGTMFFSAWDSEHGTELWRTDGTGAGTRMVADVNASTWSSGAHAFRTTGGILYFEANDGDHGPALWRSDGTEAGTVLVADPDPGTSPADGSYLFNGIAAVGNAVYAWYSKGLWRTDVGTGVSTRIDDFRAAEGPNWIASAFTLGGRFYFLGVNAADSVLGLWSVDDAGALALVMQLPGISTSDVFVLGEAVRGRIFLRLQNESHINELWTSDGTAHGTIRLRVGAPSFDHAVLRGNLYFSCGSAAIGEGICRSDGTIEGTIFFKQTTPRWSGGPGGFASSGELLFFFASDGVHGHEPWVSDGTPEGTRMLADLAAGPTSSFVWTTALPFGRRFVFGADDGVSGKQVWITDGTEAGTRILARLGRGGAPVGLGQGQEFDGFLYFTVDTEPGSGHGPGELWRTDGTPEGTVRIPDVEMPIPLWMSAEFTVAVNKLFFVAKDLDHGWEPWVVDARPPRVRRHLSGH